MHARLIALLGVWLAWSAPLSAQTPPQIPGPAPVPPSLALERLPVDPLLQPELPAEDPYRFWIRGEYLLWWLKDAPQPISVVRIGSDGARSEMFPASIDYGAFSGYRLSAGAWLDSDYRFGIEGGGFALERRHGSAFATSDNAGNPFLGLSFFNQSPGANGSEALLPISSPGTLIGNVYMTSYLELWGTEINAAICLWRRPGFEFTLLAGFRYAELCENLYVGTVSSNIAVSPNVATFVNDYFHTTNQLYAGQLGTRFSWSGERFALDVTGKLALGTNNQSVDVYGDASQYGTGSTYYSGGLFAQSTNMGRFTSSQFSLMPSLEVRLRCLLTQHVQAFVGYDVLYWSQVVRPGSQVDRNLNLSQSSVFGPGTFSGGAYPAPLFDRSDFWAQGMTFGIELQF